MEGTSGINLEQEQITREEGIPGIDDWGLKVEYDFENNK